jgi:hypothetical protein
MPLSIPIPDVAWSEQDVSLGGSNYTFTYQYNSRDSRWRFDLALEDTVVISGVKVVENQSLLDRYKLDDFNHGDIFCLRVEDDNSDVGRNNLGIGKSYELVYYTNAELAAL